MSRPQKKDLQQRIIKSAEKLFFRYGFHKVPLDDIVSDAATSKAVIYRFYRSKEDLVEDILLRLNNKINSNISVIINNSSISFNDKLEKIISFTSDLFLSINKVFLTDLVKYTPELNTKYNNMRLHRIESQYKKLFSEGIESGNIRKDIPLDFISFYYGKVMEIAVAPQENTDFTYSPKKTYQLLSILFFEGTKA